MAGEKILIIDDEEGIVDEVRDFFQEEGFTVFTAYSGTEGINALQTCDPHVCMIDLKLPDMSGLQVLKVVKETRPNVGAIVNTGYVDQAMIDEAERLGCDVFLHKPFDLMKLYDEVMRLIELKAPK